MDAILLDIVVAFGFNEMQTTIVLISMVFFLVNIVGGFMSSIFLAFGGPIRRRKPMDRMSVRMLLLAELFLFLWAFYYHAMVVVSISIEHAIYWAASLIIAPLLAYIGAQITYLIFRKKIEGNIKAYLKVLAKRKAQREAKKSASAASGASGA